MHPHHRGERKDACGPAFKIATLHPVAKDLVRFADSRERVVSAFDRPYRDIACRTVRAKPVVLALA